MKNFFFLVLVLIMSNASAQKTADSNVSKNAVYVELLGSAGFVYNVSYDRIIYSKGLNHLTLAIGAQVNLNYYLPNSITPQINYLRGKTHFFETGVGLYRNEKRYRAVILRFGYRYQKKHTNFFFKAAFTPVFSTFFYKPNTEDFQEGRFIKPWGGISFGRSF